MAKKTSVVAKTKVSKSKQADEAVCVVNDHVVEENGLVDTITGQYTVTLSVSNEVFTIDTDSIALAISDFVPSKVNGKTIVEIQKGDRRYVKIYNTFQARRLFSNKLMSILLERDALRKLN